MMIRTITFIFMSGAMLTACTMQELQRGVYTTGAAYQCQQNTEADPNQWQDRDKACFTEAELDGKDYEEYRADRKQGK